MTTVADTPAQRPAGAPGQRWPASDEVDGQPERPVRTLAIAVAVVLGGSMVLWLATILTVG
jgi:hypothetical protein